MKILFVYADKNCSCTQKLVFDLSKFVSPLVEKADLLYFTDIDEKLIESYDVFFFQRLGANGGYFTPPLIEKYKKFFDKCSKPTFYYIDDLLLHDQGGVPIFFIKSVDTVIVPNHTLERCISSYNKNIEIFRTFTDTTRELTHIKSPKFTITTASTGGLGIDFLKELIPKIKRDDVEINCIGNYGQLRRLGANTHLVLPKKRMYDILDRTHVYLNLTSMSNFVKNLVSYRLGEFSLDDFVNCKSEIKYAMAGLTKCLLITSPSDSYKYVIKNGVNGFMLEESADEWAKLINDIVDNGVNNDIVEMAYNHVTNEYSLENRAKEFVKILGKNL